MTINQRQAYVNFPFKEGITFPTALAAPVDDGIMLLLTLRPPRQSLFEGPSTVFCVAVVAWTVVINPSTIPKLSWTILARGARQLVVHEALEIYANLNEKKKTFAKDDERKTHDCVLGIVLVKIDATHKHGCVGRRGGDNNLLCSTFQMRRGPGTFEVLISTPFNLGVVS